MVFLATFSLEISVFSVTIFAMRTSFSTAIATSRRFNKIAALWSGKRGRCFSGAFLLSVYFLGAHYIPEQEWRADAVRRRGDGGVADLLLTLNNFVASPSRRCGAGGERGDDLVARADGMG